SAPCGLTWWRVAPARAPASASASACRRTSRCVPSGVMGSSRRPKCARSSYEGWAPMATPCSWHRAMARRMLAWSPAWPPQAMLAEEIHGAMAASSPKPSPKSQLKSIQLRMGVVPGVDGQGDALQPPTLIAQGLVGLLPGARHEPQRIPRAQLAHPRVVREDHMTGPGVAAGGLGVGEQHDG